MTDTQELLAQVVELQSQMAFQEDTIAALNEAIASQQREILVLREQMTLLKQRQEEQAAQLDQGGPAADQRPPHY
ncbi:SlyX family protein [Seongchinamella sediminis]|uniref:SlyX family protein n=1 Tax=Seongchinamella sediminis TaxID=2283635 RepID=A0A3L7E141_9GAMM|nr:SlyX family protein [Seongchinamella sediminis]RLQ23236.1 SlyX family protein [Seongchinamella sediminis]